LAPENDIFGSLKWTVRNKEDFLATKMSERFFVFKNGDLEKCSIYLESSRGFREKQ
jgi:hypothetical protein